jgi:transcriptional regulator GlxA family with amidase domain
VPPHRDGGQAQYIERPVPDAAGSGTEATRAWAVQRLDEPITLADMAAHASMSVRTFTRRFREETGESPGQWLVRRRVDAARQLLEDTDLAVEQIAARCGFGTAQSLRLHVQATLGVSPTQYRRTFHAAA